MKIGVCIPHTARGCTPERIKTWAREIDRGPFHSLSFGERISGRAREMQSLLGAAAAVTERVRIMPVLYVLPMRSAVVTAQQAATLDVVSSGRAAVGVGVGGREGRCRAAGPAFERRHEHLADQVATMRRIWRGDVASKGGEEVDPAPPQGANIPVYAGAVGARAIGRAAKWADGIYGPSMCGDRQGHEAIFRTARAAWAAAGRTGAPYLIGSFWCSLSPEAETDLKSHVYDCLKVFGDEVGRRAAASMTRHTPAAVRQAIENVRAAGADELLICPATARYEELDGLAALVS